MPTIVDIGQFVVTTERAVFTGPKQTREFDFSKLLSVSRQSIGKSNSVLYLPVSNRKTVTGVGTGEGSLDIISARLHIGIGLKRGSKDAMISELRNEIENLKKNPPEELSQYRSKVPGAGCVCRTGCHVGYFSRFGISAIRASRRFAKEFPVALIGADCRQEGQLVGLKCIKGS